MKLTIDDVRYIAHLARLEIADSDLEQLVVQLREILAYVDKLNAVVTDDVAPMAQSISLVNVFREDVTQTSCPVEQSLANAPATSDNMFEVPKIIG